MAEIKIEKKRPIWPWIILVLIILAILYFLFFGDEDRDEIDDIDETEQIEDGTVWEDDPELGNEQDTTAWDTASDTLSGTGVAGYLTYVADTSRMGVDHQYTNNALVQLVQAVQAKAQEMNYDIEADMESVRQDAQAIQKNPTSKDHANRIKQAGTKLADILGEMQQEKYPNLNTEVSELKTAANNIDGTVPTLEQKEQINSFFKEAADVLRKMS